ncbi:MAG TPA: GNAT family N-acetyltransferase [Anaerolineae bacterium]|nr:GNAT family N-acetyltransferase [Anaerolineae bacterium]
MIITADAYTIPVTLEGRWARLEPLTLEHADALFEVAQDEEIWRYMPAPTPRSSADVAKWIQDALEMQAHGQVLPFVIIEQETGMAIGSTRYLDISAHDRHVEIGWTWLGKSYWRTPINTECKYLLLRHAFETLGCIRVQLKTDLRNERSQRAIERIGGVREGVLRRVVIMYNGYERSSVFYSILDNEWADVKARLEERMHAE